MEEARKILGEAAVLGYSAHSPEEAARAFAGGANYVSLSPVFRPLSKQGDFKPLGLEQFSEACSFLAGPVYALGGIRLDMASSIRLAGAAGAGVVSALLEAEDPAAAAETFLQRWEASCPGPGE